MKKFFILFFSTFVLFFTGCNSEKKEALKILAARESAIEDFVNQLPDSQKVAQLFLLNIEGNTNFVPVEKEINSGLSEDPQSSLVPGGCLLFSYNIGDTPDQFISYLDSIRNFYISNGKIPPYIALDAEGGDVNRLRKMNSPFPSQKWIAGHLDIDKARSLYENQARQMKNLGIHMNLAPVVEIENDENKAFLDTRTFGNKEKVITYAGLEINSFESEKIGCVLKHFPGNSNADPHALLPEIYVTKEELESQYIDSFKILLAESSALLMSHAKIFVTDQDGYDSELPACLSPFWVQKVVRNECNFDGLIISDDIFMGALQKSGFTPEIAVIQAIESGIDVLMLSEKRFGKSAEVLFNKLKEDSVFAEKINAAVKRIIRFKIKTGILEMVQLPSQKGTYQFKIQLASETSSADQRISDFREAKRQGMEIFK